MIEPVESDEFVDRIRSVEAFWLNVVLLPPDDDDRPTRPPDQYWQTFHLVHGR